MKLGLSKSVLPKLVALAFSCLLSTALTVPNVVSVCDDPPIETQGKKLLVAVLEPVGNSTVKAINKAAVRGTLDEFITMSNKWQVVDRSRTDQILKEHQFTREGGMVDQDQVRKIGKLLGADLVCASELLKEEGYTNVNIVLINVETGVIEGSGSDLVEGDSPITMKNLVVKIASRITGVGADGRGMSSSVARPSAVAEHKPSIAEAPKAVVSSTVPTYRAQNSTKRGGLTGGPGVYVAGRDKSGWDGGPIVWKDGKAFPLTTIHDPGARTGTPTSVFVAGDAVLAVGESFDDFGFCATLWVNGQRQLLSKVNGSEANSVYVWGDKDYIVGNEGKSAVMWVNGERQALAGLDQANSVFVVGNDVYVAGAYSGKAILWKNGSVQVLSTSDKSATAVAYSVYVSNGIVYAAGASTNTTGTYRAVLWRNGVEQDLDDAAPRGSERVFFFGRSRPLRLGATSVSVTAGGDVYVAGTNYDADTKKNVSRLWKNGTEQNLLVGNSGQAEGTSVFVMGEEVFVAGVDDNDKAVLWRNGVPQVLSEGSALSVFVK